MTVYTPPFDTLTSAADLDRIASVRAGTVERVLASPREALYTRHNIPKRDRTRGYRVVWEVVDDDWARGLRTLNRHLRSYLAEQNLPGEAAHGYAIGRSIVTNARQHLAAPVIVRADIADFFRTITKSRVQATLERATISSRLSELIAELCCIENSLALGLAPSPTIANVVAAGVDARFLQLLTDRGQGRYTRYADDLTFSGRSDELPDESDIAEVFRHEGFRLAKGKYKRKSRGQSVLVTGLSVFDDQLPRAPKQFKRRIRQELHYIDLFGVHEHADKTGYGSTQACINNVDGRIQYLRGVEPLTGQRLNRKWKALLARDRVRVSWEARGLAGGRATVFVDESVIETVDQATNESITVMAMAMIVVRDVQAVRDELREFAQELKQDWRRTGTGGRFLQKGALHYVDLAEDVRAEVAKLLESISFRAFVAYQLLDSRTTRQTWLQLYRSLLRGRLAAMDGADVAVVVEQNSVPTKHIRGASLEVFQSLVNGAERRPARAPEVHIVSKTDDPGIWLPDVVLGLFGDYARSLSNGRVAPVAPQKRPSTTARFERVRDKIRMVRSFVSDTHWSAKKPFAPWIDGRPS